MNTQLKIQHWKENQNKVEAFRELLNNPLLQEAISLLRESNYPQPVLFSHWELSGDKQVGVYGFNEHSETERSHNLARVEGVSHALNFLEELTQYAEHKELKNLPKPFEYNKEREELEALQKATAQALVELNQNLDNKK